MFKKWFNKIKEWHNNRELQDYYDPYSGTVFIVNKDKDKDNKKEKPCYLKK